MLILYFFLFILFLFVGSFFGVVIDRVYRSEQFVRGRSYCDSCKHILKVLDLIPVFSYLVLNGKCRYCKKNISKWLPITELLTATVLTLTIFFTNQTNSISPFAQHFFNLPYPSLILIINFIALAISAVLILIFITDARHMVIPDVYLYILGALYPFYLVFFKLQLSQSENISILKDNLIAAVILAAFFAALHYGSRKKAMGDGDIYLAGIMGLYLGIKLSVVMWFMAFLTGATLGVILLISRKKKMNSAVPFGPFLILGFAIAIFFGLPLWNWYVSHI